MAALRECVTIFGSSQPKAGDAAYTEAEALGKALAEAGFDVANGGYFGTMEATSRGATSAGGGAHGVVCPVLFPQRVNGNDFLTQRTEAPSLLDRISVLCSQSRFFVVLPGTVGTLTELCVIWNLATLGDVGHWGRPVRIFCYRAPWEALVGSIGQSLGVCAPHMACVEFVDDAAAAAAAVAKAAQEAPYPSGRPAVEVGRLPS